VGVAARNSRRKHGPVVLVQTGILLLFFSGACVASLVPSSRLTLPDHPPPPFNYPRPTTPPHDDHSPGLPASKNERACMGRERVR
jgi:hypothetical protein